MVVGLLEDGSLLVCEGGKDSAYFFLADVYSREVNSARTMGEWSPVTG